MRSDALWALAGVVVVGAVVPTGCGTQTNHTESPQSAPPKTDCSVIEPLGPEWIAMQRSVVQQGKSANDKQDLIAIADVESAMSDKIRAVQSSVSAQNLKDQLGTWADGTALSAKAQRAEASPTPPPAPADPNDADTVRAARLISDATGVLRQACPKLKLP